MPLRIDFWAFIFHLLIFFLIFASKILTKANDNTTNLKNNMEKLLAIANSYAEEFCSDAIHPAHLFKAILHKEIGLIDFIEKELDKDYYYLLDWADVQVQLAPRSARPKRDLEFCAESEAVEKEAENYRAKFGLEEVDAVCWLASLVTPGVGFSFDELKTLPLTPAEIAAVKGTAKGAAKVEAYPTHPAETKKATGTGAIAKYCINKIAEAADGKLGTVIGFADETQTICEIMGRMTKANLLIVGEAGVGKTSLVNSFVKRVQSGEVPAFLQGTGIYEIDLAAIGADAQYKGEIDDRFKNVFNEIADMGNAILVIESIDKVFDKQGALYGAATILKSELSKCNLRLLCTSSIEGFTKNIETDKEMLNKLEKLTVNAPDDNLCMDILKGVMPMYEEFHAISVPEESMTESIRLAKRYLTERALPDSALGLLDRTLAHKKSVVAAPAAGEEKPSLSMEDLCAVIAQQTGVPMGKVQTQERDRLLGAEETMKQRVIGQDHAVKKVLDSVFESRSGLNKKGQPMGSFFFLGPTGTGKTELAKTLATFLFGNESSLIRFDMSEFKEEHSVALLYGAPPGYVGYEEGGLLVNKIRQQPYSVVLFDEIEKAHKSVFDLFLQILDEGKLHDRLGRVGDFSNALILFTSNIGSQFISKTFQEGRIPENSEMMDIMQDYFRPEFLARLTEIVPFSPITEETVAKIFSVHLKGLVKLLEEQDMHLEMTDEVLRKIAMKGFNPAYGARPIIGNIRKDLRQPLSKMIISGKVKAGDTIVVTVDENSTPQFEVKNK